MLHFIKITCLGVNISPMFSTPPLNTLGGLKCDGHKTVETYSFQLQKSHAFEASKNRQIIVIARNIVSMHSWDRGNFLIYPVWFTK